MMQHSFRSTGLKFRPLSPLSTTCHSLAVMLGLTASVLFSPHTILAAPAANPALLQEDFPFQGACISAEFPKGNTAMKGLAIRLGNGASMLFDTDLLRMAAGWTGRYITTQGVTFDGGHGGHPKIDGEQKFGTRVLPGWLGARDEFKDPRAEPFGPLPADWARYDGLYVNGMEVVLAYTVRGAKILEQPASVVAGGQTGFVRTFKTPKLKEALTLLVCEHESAPAQVNKEGTRASLKPAGDRLTQVGVAGLPKGAVLDIISDRIVLRLPKGAPAATFNVVIWNGAAADAAKFDALLIGTPKLAEIKKGGPARWPQAVETQGVVAASKTPDGAYVLDSLTAPLNNPWKRRVRFGGLDFFPDGKRAALSTWDGDIWIVSGIDEKLEHLQWRRFASGMYETLGLKIVNGVIYTSGRDQLTRYHDLNKDGEADYYENFCNLQTSSEGFHEFLFDLQTDAKGNFYFAKAGPVKPGGSGFETISASAGALMKVSPDGKKLEVYATGFRAPNGIGVSPTGQVTTGDNEGTWIPTCPINWVKPGGFYGVEQLAHKSPVPAFNPPLCWLSKNGWDNSGGGQIWVTSKQWGPFYGELFHCSYGECALYLVMKQEVNGLMQGGAVRLPVKFTSSAMRPKFNPKDGQLYVAGLQGWQTKAPKLAGLDRVRFTGKGVYSVRDLKVNKQGIHLTFTQPLDPAAAGDAENYAVTRWNYERAGHYGSPEYSVATPGKKGRDTVEVTGVKVSPDGKTVTLQIADLKPVMQQQIKFNLKAKDGTAISQEIQHTIHVVPEGGLAAAK